MILIAMHERNDPSDTPEEQLGRVVSDFSIAGVQDQEQYKDDGMVAERPRETLSEEASKGDHVGQGVSNSAQLGSSSGERSYPSIVIIGVDILQL